MDANNGGDDEGRLHTNKCSVTPGSSALGAASASSSIIVTTVMNGNGGSSSSSSSVGQHNNGRGGCGNGSGSLSLPLGPQGQGSSDTTANGFHPTPSLAAAAGGSTSSRVHGHEEETVMADDEDECCVYTYRGGTRRTPADLPSSFYKFDPSDSSQPSSSSSGTFESAYLNGSSGGHGSSNGQSSSSNNTNNNGSGSSSGLGSSNHHSSSSNPNRSRANDTFSPDMDFLEMDFDPGGPEEEDEDGMSVEEGQGNSAARDIDLRVGEAEFEQRTEELRRMVAVAGQGLITYNTHHHHNQPGTSSSSSLTYRVVGTRSSDVTDGSPTRRGHGQSSSSSSLHLPPPHNNADTDACSTASTSPTSTLSPDPSTAGFPSPSTSTYTNNPPNNNNVNLAQAILSSPKRGDPQGLALRLVKSNTLPEIGSSNSRWNSGRSSSSSSTTEPRLSGISYSVPLIPDPPNYTVVLNTNTNRSSSSDERTEAGVEDSVKLEVGGVMIWTIDEASEKAWDQIGKSACGATAICNVLLALGWENVDPQLVNLSVQTRYRAEDAELPAYLFSRGRAGATADDLISGVQVVSNGSILSRFFRPNPNLSPDAFSKWLLHWICKGAIPVLTRNLQVSPWGFPDSQEIPDFWHHQMIFGLSPKGIFTTNPVECVPLQLILKQITTPSVLLVQRQDVIKRKGPMTDLRALARHPDPRWNQLNVLGQVANMLLEETPVFNGAQASRRVRTSHVTIPAEYKGGVTLFLPASSPHASTLQDAPDLIT